MSKVRHVFSFDFIDSLLIFIWIALPTLAILGLAFPVLVSPDHIQLYGLSAFFLLTAGRFMSNFGHNPWVEMPPVYVSVLFVFYFVLGRGTYEWFLAIGPTCAASMAWPGILYVAKQVKPVAVVSDRTFMRERILQNRS